MKITQLTLTLLTGFIFYSQSFAMETSQLGVLPRDILKEQILSYCFDPIEKNLEKALRLLEKDSSLDQSFQDVLVELTKSLQDAVFGVACKELNAHFEGGINEIIDKVAQKINKPQDLLKILCQLDSKSRGGHKLYIDINKNISIKALQLVIRALIQAGAKVNSPNNNVLPFTEVLQNEQVKLAIALFKEGGAKDVDERDEDDKTLLMMAAKKNQPKLIEILLKAEAGINVQDTYGNTPLLWAIINASTDAFDALLKHGADVDLANKNGITPFLKAIQEVVPQMQIKLLQVGANVKKGDAGSKMLIQSAQRGDFELLKQLIGLNVDINYQDIFGDTVLMVVAKNGRAQVVRDLIEWGADIHVTNNENKTALDIAKENNYPTIVQALEDAESKSEKDTILNSEQKRLKKRP